MTPTDAWDHVHLLEDGNVACDYCLFGFYAEKTTPKRILFHLSGLGDQWILPCPSVTNELKTAAQKALQLYAVNPKTGRPRQANPPAAPRATDSVFVLVLEAIRGLVGTQDFVPNVASLVYYFGAGIPRVVKPPPIRDQHFHGGKSFDSKTVKELLTGYRHATQILDMRAAGHDFLLFAEDVEEYSGSSDYAVVVAFLTGTPKFWDDAVKFTRLLEPLMQVLQVLSACGTSLGHVATVCETARTLYTMIPNLSLAARRILRRLWVATLNVVSNCAKFFDPAYFLGHGDGGARARDAIESFSEVYVREEDLVAFNEELDLYVDASDQIFDAVGINLLANHHPAKFWFYGAIRTPVLSFYASRVASMRFGVHFRRPTHLQHLIAGDIVLDEATIDRVGPVLRYPDGDQMMLFLEANSSLVGGFEEFSSRLEKFDYLPWEFMDLERYELFIANIEAYLK